MARPSRSLRPTPTHWRSRDPRWPARISAGARAAAPAQRGDGRPSACDRPWGNRRPDSAAAAATRIARQRARDVDALIVEACQPIGRGLRRRGSDRTAEAVGRDLDGLRRRRTPASASARRRRAGAPAATRYPDIRSRSASMRRRRDRDRRTQNARPSAGYATQTSIRSRNAYTHVIEFSTSVQFDLFCWYRI